MDEEKFTRQARSSHRRVEPEAQTKEKTYGSKLKNDTSRSEAMRKKLRTGKADTAAETLKEKKHKDKLRAQTKKKGAPKPVDAAVSAKAHDQFAEANQDDNAGGDAINAGTQAVEKGLYYAKVKSHDKKTDGYGKKLHKKKKLEEAKEFQKGKDASLTSGTTSKELQKNRMKKEIQRNAIKQRSKEAANGVGSVTKNFVDKAEDMVGKMAEAVTEFLTKFVKEHPYGAIIAVLILMVVLVIVASLTSCGAGAGGVSNMTLSTSFTAEDDAIIAVNDDYTGLEADLQREIQTIETDYPGYDEYNYSLNEISHNPFELAALLTVLYEDYTEAEVQPMLQTIKDSQYTLTKTRVVETRTRTVTKWHWVTRYRTVIINGVPTQQSYQSYESYQVEEEYEYYILNVTLTNHGIDYVARNKLSLSAEQLQRYEILLETFGNKKYLFEDNPYAAPSPGDYYASANATLIAVLDRLFYSSHFDKTMKVGAAVASARRGGLTATFDELNKYFTISGMPVASGQYWNGIHGSNANDAVQDEEGMQQMRTLARNMSFLMKSIALGKEKYGLPEKEAHAWTNFIR